MAAYIIVDVDVKNAAGFDAYRQAVPATIAQYGGRYLVRGGRHETLEGTWHPTRLVVLEFPSLEAAKGWYESDQYQKIKPLRLQHASGDMVLVEGL
ncbi:MAG TPA: DUF1330 domain-containing protein [Candidatus Methylomirabilis sp.]|nr:DUF1330 domain-containing protein [Candidatus Methylomirabilis sp.]HSC70248.1 DUF1330 domain-containing protein [Candidatus Methylomirabilis sp.]